MTLSLSVVAYMNHLGLRIPWQERSATTFGLALARASPGSAVSANTKASTASTVGRVQLLHLVPSAFVIPGGPYRFVTAVERVAGRAKPWRRGVTMIRSPNALAHDSASLQLECKIS